jgi:hypothetical protein
LHQVSLLSREIVNSFLPFIADSYPDPQVLFTMVTFTGQNQPAFLSLAGQSLIRLTGRLRRSSSDDVKSQNKAPRAPYRNDSLATASVSCLDEEHTLSSSSIASNQISDETIDMFGNILELLSGNDVESNRIGIKRLTFLTTTNVPGVSYSLQVSNIIVYGDHDPTADELRRSLVRFINTSRVHNSDRRNFSFDTRDDSNASLESCNDENTSICSWSDSSSEESGLHDSKAWATLHIQALQLIASSLEHVLAAENETDRLSLDFKDSFWPHVVGALRDNVERCRVTDVTVCSLKILRLLHSLEPVLVTPFLRQTLFPYLAHLEVEGKLAKSPLVESEASTLMRRATWTMHSSGY